MADVTVKWDDRQLRFALRTIPVALGEEWTKGFKATVHEFNRRMVREQLTGPRPSKLGVRSGHLRRSFVPPAISGTQVQDLKAIFGSTAKYAPIHEYGGVVHGRPWLTIPLPAALTAAGVPRYPSARAVPDLRVIRTKRGSLLLAKLLGGGRIEPWYVLKRSVYIPPRLGAKKMLESMQGWVRDTLAAATDRALRRSAQGGGAGKL